MNIMPAIQTCFLMLQKTEHIKKWPKMVSNGVPQIDQRSLKIHPGTFQGPSVCICDSLDCKMVLKWCPRTSRWTQNGHLVTLKGAKNQQNAIIHHVTNRFIYCMFIHWFQSWKPVLLFLPILSVCKSADHWLPEGPAAGAKPKDIHIYPPAPACQGPPGCEA